MKNTKTFYESFFGGDFSAEIERFTKNDATLLASKINSHVEQTSDPIEGISVVEAILDQHIDDLDKLEDEVLDYDQEQEVKALVAAMHSFAISLRPDVALETRYLKEIDRLAFIYRVDRLVSLVELSSDPTLYVVSVA